MIERHSIYLSHPVNQSGHRLQYPVIIDLLVFVGVARIDVKPYKFVVHDLSDWASCQVIKSSHCDTVLVK